MKKLLALGLMLSLAGAGMAQQLLDEIVAIVDDSVILRSELDRSTASISKQLEARNTQLPPRSILERQVLERLIITEILAQRAQQAGIRVSDAEVDTALSQIARQNNINLEQMRQAVEADGFEFATFREDMRRDMLTERVRYSWASSQVKISEHEVDLFLADNELNQGEVDLQHILIATPAEPKPEDIEAARSKAEEVHGKITQGEDFAVLATQYSDGQNALEGGKLGWRPVNQLPPLFADQIKAMSAGDFTRPIRSPNGFHILKVVDKKSKSSKLVEQAHAQHIMVETNEVVTPRDGMQLINALYDKIQAGEDFAQLAQEHSDDHSSAPLGGDLGWFEVAQYGERFENVLRNLSDDEVSRPFQTEAGWHILKRLGLKQADVTEEYQREQAKNAIRQRKMQQIMEDWVRQVRGEAFVDIRI